jgi:hypothetical protein
MSCTMPLGKALLPALVLQCFQNKISSVSALVLLSGVSIINCWSLSPLLKCAFLLISYYS